jgi:hypothetical protein
MYVDIYFQSYFLFSFRLLLYGGLCNKEFIIAVYSILPRLLPMGNPGVP